MSDRVGLAHCPEARSYDFGPEHPLRPERVLLTWSLIRAYGLDELPHVSELRCPPATDAEIELVHTPEFVDATRRAGHGERGVWGRFGYGPGDNPVFSGMHEAAALVCGASLAAARAVFAGEVEHAFNAAGGLHHAMPGRASGFCVYDDPAVAIAWLLARGVPRVAYVDVDVHHGDGPQAIFYEDPRVLTISLHESGEYLFPGTGSVEERGAGAAEGTKVNVPLPPGTGDDAWLRAFRAIVPPVVRAFEPNILVSQLGCDTHYTDPLAHLELTTSAYRTVAAEFHLLAHEVAGGRWIATGGGGYQWARVAPRAWTIAFGEMVETEPNDSLPEPWIEEAEELFQAPVPATLSEEPLPPGHGDELVDELLGVVRRTAFPTFDLDPTGP